MLKLLNKFVLSKKIIADIKTKKKAPKVKNENSMEVSANGNENENISAPKSKKKKNEENKSKSSKSSKSGSKKLTATSKDKEHKKKKKKKRDLTAPAMHYTASVEPQLVDGDLSPEVFAQCKEKMRPVKKALKQLDNPEKGLSKEEKDKQITKCLLKIGERITECLNEIQDELKKKEWRNNLWTFVSKFTEYDPKKLYKIYKHTVKKQNKNQEKIDRHHHNNGDTSNNQYSHHNSSNSNLSISSGSNQHQPNFYQSKLNNNNKFNISHQQQQRHTTSAFQAKDSYHHHSEKRGLSNNSPNKRIRSDDHSFQRNVLNSSNPVSPSSHPQQANRPNNSWHNSNDNRYVFRTNCSN